MKNVKMSKNAIPTIWALCLPVEFNNSYTQNFYKFDAFNSNLNVLSCGCAAELSVYLPEHT